MINIQTLPIVNNKHGWPWIAEKRSLPPTMPDGSSWPKISIVTPSYNQGQYIEETIRSVLLQGYPNLEYIIIDGGSTDNSVDIIKKYENWLTYWVTEKDRGQSHAINKGFARSSGQILNWLNSDDYLLPDALFKIANKYISRKSDYLFIGGNALILKENGDLIPRWSIRQASERIQKIGGRMEGGIQASWFFSKPLYILAGPIDEKLHYAMDIDFWFRCNKFFPENLIEETPIAVYREQPKAKTYTLNEVALQERLQVYERSIIELSSNKKMRKEREKIARYEISSLYLKRTSKPIKFKYLFRAIYLSPERLVTRDFWRTVFHRLIGIN